MKSPYTETLLYLTPSLLKSPYTETPSLIDSLSTEIPLY